MHPVAGNTEKMTDPSKLYYESCSLPFTPMSYKPCERVHNKETLLAFSEPCHTHPLVPPFQCYVPLNKGWSLTYRKLYPVALCSCLRTKCKARLWWNLYRYVMWSSHLYAAHIKKVSGRNNSWKVAEICDHFYNDSYKTYVNWMALKPRGCRFMTTDGGSMFLKKISCA